ncbi:MAG: hypothetical protein ACR2K3_02695 [Nocardioides sp.]
MIEIDEELGRLADSVELPATTPDDDLARGRAARRTRNLAAVGASAVGVAMVVTGVAMLSGGTGDRAVEPGPAGGGTTSPSPSANASHHPRKAHHTRTSKAPADPFAPMAPAGQRVVRETLNSFHDVLTDDLDPGGTRLAPFSNLQSGGGGLGTKFDWSGGGMLEIDLQPTAPKYWSFAEPGFPLTPRHVAGARMAKAGSDPTSTTVVVVRNDGTAVQLTASSEFGNNGTSIAATGLTVEQLLAAAADPRLTLPDPVPLGEPGPGLFR